MTTSNNHDEYAAAAAQPNQGGSMKPYLKAAVTFAAAYVTTLGVQEQGVDVTQLSDGDFGRALLVAIPTTVLMFFTKYQSTRATTQAPPPNH
jgi:hypothetical protein